MSQNELPPNVPVIIVRIPPATDPTMTDPIDDGSNVVKDVLTGSTSGIFCGL
jgi:hypothetical protein